jgi:hypothetical protein
MDGTDGQPVPLRILPEPQVAVCIYDVHNFSDK